MQRISDEELAHYIAELDAEWEAFKERGENSPNIGEAFDNVARDLRDARAEIERIRQKYKDAELLIDANRVMDTAQERTGAASIFAGDDSRVRHIRRTLRELMEAEGLRIAEQISAELKAEVERLREEANYNPDERNIGSNLTADIMLKIATDGRGSGTFGGEKVEACAAAIQALRDEVERMRPVVEAADRMATLLERVEATAWDGDPRRRLADPDCIEARALVATYRQYNGETDAK